MPLPGQPHRVGDHVNTDVIIPGRYLTLRDPAQLGPHCLEGLDPTFAARVNPGDILVAGRNFGSGSSREHAILALQGAGIAAVIASSVARIFFRNAINLALPVMVCPEAAEALRDDLPVEVDPVSGRITQGNHTWHATPLAGEVAAILAAGGLVPHLRNTMGSER